MHPAPPNVRKRIKQVDGAEEKWDGNFMPKEVCAVDAATTRRI
jgi:hypothetical protein